jgi:sigma-B regulation protein RsbU (phosphoserine phosphatase)
MGSTTQSKAWIHPRRPGRTLARRARVGFLTDSFTEYYQLSLLRGAIEAARDRWVNLVAFAAGVPSTPVPNRALASPTSVDALIVTASTMAYQLGVEGLADYCRGLGDLPMCFIGAQAEGLSAILTDNASGMETAVRHLTEVHGKRRVAFIGGPPGNPEADARLEAYRRVLTETGIEYDEALIAYGDFMRHSGRKAMAEILDRGAKPDALAAANDMMVLGACEILDQRGLAVPDDVAVVGFDDVEEGRFGTPALSSVRQPLEQQGREAVRVALEAIEGKGEPEAQTLKLELVIRTSCGCGSQASGLAPSSGPASRSFELALGQRRAVVVAEMSRAAQASLGRVSPRWCEQLFQGLLDDLRITKSDRFLAALRTEVVRSRESGGSLGVWHRVLSILRADAARSLASDPSRLSFAEDMFHEARELLAIEMQNEQAMRRMRLQQRVLALRESGLALGGVASLEELAGVLAEHLGRLGFKRGYLSVFDQASGNARLLLGYDRDLPLEEHAGSLLFEASELTPPGLRAPDQDQTCVVLPLVLGGEELGLMLVDEGCGDGLVWETLREQVALALRFCMLNK